MYYVLVSHSLSTHCASYLNVRLVFRALAIMFHIALHVAVIQHTISLIVIRLPSASVSNNSRTECWIPMFTLLSRLKGTAHGFAGTVPDTKPAQWIECVRTDMSPRGIEQLLT